MENVQFALLTLTSILFIVNPIAVIPTCTVEITRTGSSISRSADSAPFPPRARSAPRRAVTIEYSPMTKNALPAIRASSATMRKRSSKAGDNEPS